VRELALTSRRLVCIESLKSGRGVTAEFRLHEAQVGREKRAKGDEAGMITSVELRAKSVKESFM